MLSSRASRTSRALDTRDGLVLVDTGGLLAASRAHAALRRWSDRPVHTAIYTHGHVDHVHGITLFEREPNRPRVRVIAHEALPARLERYARTAGLNAIINRRQFRLPNLQWPTSYRQPDLTYRSRLVLEVGGTRLELRHARGETDDHTWVLLPAKRVLATGDLFLWVSPNAGNPQKVQRYALDWAIALREMADLGAEVLCPGHGVPIFGAERVRQALSETAELLQTLHDETLAAMNRGATLDEILQSVRAPASLLDRPYLQPMYDEPEFVVRNVWRLYGGWYDGNPAHLKPAPEAQLATELASLAGGAARLAARALELADAGQLRLASHLAELAWRADPDEPLARSARADVYRRRSAAERSLMARGIFQAAADETS